MVIGQAVARFPHLVSRVAVVAVLLAGAAWSMPASASITVELSPEVVNAFKAHAKSDTQRAITKKLQGEFNLGLEELGKTNPDAKALFDSGQKLRIVCFGTKEAEDAGLTKDAALTPGIEIVIEAGGGAKTKGDFDANGKPKVDGTTIIAIDCEQLLNVGLATPIIEFDPNTTFYRILIHELLHAANINRQHPPDELDIYRQFVRDFEAALDRARARPPRQAKGKIKAKGQLPSTPMQSITPPGISIELGLGFRTGRGQELDRNKNERRRDDGGRRGFETSPGITFGR